MAVKAALDAGQFERASKLLDVLQVAGPLGGAPGARGHVVALPTRRRG